MYNGPCRYMPQSLQVVSKSLLTLWRSEALVIMQLATMKHEYTLDTVYTQYRYGSHGRVYNRTHSNSKSNTQACNNSARVNNDHNDYIINNNNRRLSNIITY